MKRNWIRLALTSVAALAPTFNAFAIEYNWNVLGGGSQTWQTAANWNPNTGFPSTPADIANLDVALTGPLTVDVGATNVKIGRLDIGSTGSAVLTDITATTPNTFLQFRNTDDANFNNDANGVDGTDFLIWQQGLGTGPGATNEQGDSNGDGFVNADDLRVWRQFMTGSGGAGLINSVGVVGATNRISAPVLSGDETGAESVDVRGTNSLNMAGGFRVVGADNNALNSFLPAGAVLTVASINTTDQADNTTARITLLNNNNQAGGRVEVTSLTGNGQLTVGNATGGQVVSTIVLANANPTFSGQFRMNRSTVLLGNDSSLGTGSFVLGAPSNWTGFNIASTADDRTISLRLNLAQYPTFTGEHSFTLTGVIYQSNARGFINILPAGEQLTLAGDIYAMSDIADTERTMILDGSGKTVITGNLKQGRFDTTTNMEATTPTPPSGITASFTKRGTGELQINGGALHTGNTTVDGGNLTYATYNDAVASASIIVNNGAVGANVYNSFSTPSTMQTDIQFLSRVAGTSTGALVIDEAAGTYDYNLALGVVPNVGLAAPVAGLTFTGTIIPTALNPNYKLGGGAGTLTLPNAQLTGANNVIATNGGTVVLSGANSYTGTTSVIGKSALSLAVVAPTNGATNVADNLRYITTTTLSVSNLQNGGVNSSIGASSNAAANLVIQGSTFRYTGAGASTDRLFTIGQVAQGVGQAGATIDASGGGALSFTNTGSIAVLVPTPTATGATTFTLRGTNTGNNTLAPVVANGTTATNLVKADAGKWILTGANTYTGTTTVSGGTLLVNGSHTGGGAYTVASGATLGGTGSIAANITTAGVLSPGASTGALAVTGNVTFSAGSTALFEIGGTTAGQFDELNIVGSLAAGGTFDVDLINGFTPVIGNSFDLLDFIGVASGSFTPNLPALPAGRMWSTANLLTTGTISVVAGVVGVPEPSSLVMGAGTLALLTVRRRRSA